MSAIFYIMGKSSSGKDTVYRQIRQDYPQLMPIVLYTTRPMRDGETEGVEYHFIDDAKLDDFRAKGVIIEERVYQTVHGPWHYATIDDGLVRKACENDYFITIGTLEAYTKMRDYYGADALIPIYLYASDETRLMRYIKRESKEENPNYKEVCRRFLADEEDFAPEKLAAAGIEEGCLIECMEEGYPPIFEMIGKVLGA